MRRKLRSLFTGLVITMGILLVFWFVLAWYIQSHKKELLQSITHQLNRNIQGSLLVEDMEPSFLVTVPYFSVRLKNVSLRDSMWQYHHHDLITAGKIYVQLNPLSLFSGRPRIHEVDISNGTIYLFTDSTGYTNSYLLQRKDTTEIKSKKQAVFNKLVMENMNVVYEDKIKHKLFHFDIGKLSGKITYYPTGWLLKSEIKTRILSLAFNTRRGSFLKDKSLIGDIDVKYDYNTRTLEVPEQPLYINNHLYQAKINLFFTDTPHYEVDVSTKQIELKEAASLTPPGISHHFDSFDLARPADVTAIIKGRMLYKDTPFVQVGWHIINNTLHTPIGSIDRCSLDGMFTNEYMPGGSHTDGNSALNIAHMKGTFQGIPFTADTIHVSNLKMPNLFCHIKASFPLQEMNTLTASETVQFNTGSADADIVYNGGLSETDTIRPHIKGYARIDNGGITYLPRNVSFTNVFALLQFDGTDLFIKNVRLKSGQSLLTMDGSVNNFLNLYFNSPDKILINWNIKSPFINLNEFSSFFKPRQPGHNTTIQHNQKLRIIRKLDVVLDACNVDMQLQIDKMLYRTFAASGITANVLLTRGGLEVKNVNLTHAGGTLSASGSIDTRLQNNHNFAVHALVNNVNIDQLFYAFADFGQDIISSKNIKGVLKAKVDLTGIMNDNAKILPHTMQGKVIFQIDNGALIHFEPLENISKYAFKKRNLSYVTLGSLKNELTIDKEKIIIPSMLVRTSAINMLVDGVYAPPKNTDLHFEVPLRNPKDDSASLNTNESINWQKGLILYLKATNDDSGNLKIGWDRSKGIFKNMNKTERQERRERRKQRKAARRKT